MEQSLMAVVSEKGARTANGFMECWSGRLTLSLPSQCVMWRKLSDRWLSPWRGGCYSRQWLASCWQDGWNQLKLSALR